MQPALSIVIATSGRPSLADTVRSAAAQLDHGDEIIVLRRDCPWGHEARNLAMRRCQGTHLLFIDDDDVYADGALGPVRQALRADPDHVHLYAMRYYDGRVLTPQWPLTMGYVSTQMLVVPNEPGRLGAWGDRYEGDFDFIASTMLLRGDAPVLHDHVVALIGPPAHARAA